MRLADLVCDRVRHCDSYSNFLCHLIIASARSIGAEFEASDFNPKAGKEGGERFLAVFSGTRKPNEPIWRNGQSKRRQARHRCRYQPLPMPSSVGATSAFQPEGVSLIPSIAGSIFGLNRSESRSSRIFRPSYTFGTRDFHAFYRAKGANLMFSKLSGNHACISIILIIK